RPRRGPDRDRCLPRQVRQVRPGRRRLRRGVRRAERTRLRRPAVSCRLRRGRGPNGGLTERALKAAHGWLAGLSPRQAPMARTAAPPPRITRARTSPAVRGASPVTARLCCAWALAVESEYLLSWC